VGEGRLVPELWGGGELREKRRSEVKGDARAKDEEKEQREGPTLKASTLRLDKRTETG